MIQRKYCPVCNAVAVLEKEFSCFGIHSKTYTCGHTVADKQLSATAFDDFTRTDGKRAYRFQSEGAKFATNSNGRFLIADAMGLGKSGQFLMFWKVNYDSLGKCLFVVKSGLKIQWFKEILTWCGNDWFTQVLDKEDEFIIPNVKGYIVSFDILRRFKDIDAWVKRLGINVVCLDEIQHIKNTESKRTNSVRMVCKNVDYIGALSGTPIKNHAGEYFPILQIIQPDKFRTQAGFEQRWVDSYWDGYKMKHGGLKNSAAFKDYTKDFIIRRTREEVLPDLPVISRNYAFSELGPVVEDAYKKELEAFQNYYNYGGMEDTAFVRSSNILSYITRMRHLTGMAKIQPVVDFVKEFIRDTDRKIVIFLHHKDVAKTLLSLLQTELANPDNGDFWGAEILALSADLDSTARAEVVDKFHKPKYRIMIGSTLASGEGLNLQCCSDCIMMERQWNPANEEQAECRFIRIGQLADKVTATYTIAVGTVDEFFSEIVERKRGICANTLDNVEYKWEESSLMKELAEVLAVQGGKRWGL